VQHFLKSRQLFKNAFYCNNLRTKILIVQLVKADSKTLVICLSVHVGRPFIMAFDNDNVTLNIYYLAWPMCIWP